MFKVLGKALVVGIGLAVVAEIAVRVWFAWACRRDQSGSR